MDESPMEDLCQFSQLQYWSVPKHSGSVTGSLLLQSRENVGISRQMMLLKSEFFVLMRIRINYLVGVSVTDFVTVVGIKLWLSAKTYKEMGRGLIPAGNWVPQCHWLNSSFSTLKACGFLSSSPMDLCTFRFLRWFQTCSPPTMASSSFSPSQPLPSLIWVVWLEL